MTNSQRQTRVNEEEYLQLRGVESTMLASHEDFDSLESIAEVKKIFSPFQILKVHLYFLLQMKLC